MKTAPFILLSCLAILLSCSSEEMQFVDTIASPESILNYVDPFIGTGGHGHTFPGATTPFGMVQCSPQTRLEGWDACSGYHYTDNRIYGFAHTALSGTGVGDYGDILLFPQLSGEPSPRNEHGQVYSTFNKTDESALAGKYCVILESGIEVELTVTPRAGVYQYTFPSGKEAAFLIDFKHRDKVLDCSNVETLSKSFSKMREAAADMWHTELSKFKIRSESHDNAVIFYTALYHSFIAPNLFSAS